MSKALSLGLGFITTDCTGYATSRLGDDSGRTLNSLRRMGGLTSGRQPGVRSELGPETNSWVGCQAARPFSTEEGPSALARPASNPGGRRS